MTEFIDASTTIPWCPESLQERGLGPWDLSADWHYVVIEEVVGGIAELQAWPWPVVDERGRLGWLLDEGEDAPLATIWVESLREQMYVRSDMERRPRAGDAFAVQLLGDAWVWPDEGPEQMGLRDPETEVARVLGGEVFDISADARLAAKLAYLAANTAVFRYEEVLEPQDEVELSNQTPAPAPELKIVQETQPGDSNSQDDA